MLRTVVLALVAAVLTPAVARADWMPTPPAPFPPNANVHAVFDPPSTTNIHLGNAENWLANQSGTFTNFAGVYGITYDGTTGWIGSWNTRPNKPVPGQPRTVDTTITWYRTDLMVACEYTATVIGPDSAIAGVDGLIIRTHCGLYTST